MSESKYECEECGRAIDQDDAWIEVDIASDLMEAIGSTTAVVHPECLEAYREKHPRDPQPLNRSMMHRKYRHVGANGPGRRLLLPDAARRHTHSFAV